MHQYVHQIAHNSLYLKGVCVGMLQSVLVMQQICNQGVASSNLATGTIFKRRNICVAIRYIQHEGPRSTPRHQLD